MNEKENSVVVAVSGYFNPVHKGHIAMFKEAKKLGDKLIVIINSDYQRKLKGSKEFMDQEERKYIIESISCVDEAVIAIDQDKTVCQTLAMLKPHIFANGGDRRNLDDIPEAAVCQQHNIQMIFNIGGEKTQSSSWLLGNKPSEITSLPFNPADKKIIIADVDDTICESCQQISSEMAAKINQLLQQGHQFAFISGTNPEDLLHMISSRLNYPHHLLGNTGTKYFYLNQQQQSEIKYSLSLSPEEKHEILTAFEKLIQQFNLQSLTTKEDQLQDRDSQITLSILGRHAPTDLKTQYDPQGKKRLQHLEFLQSVLQNRYEIKLGGTTSIDITKKGLDKEWGIRKFAEYHHFDLNQILFFGDKLYPGGNDYAATKVVDCLAVKNPKNTLQKLNELFP